MSASMYQFSVPLLTRGLTILDHYLETAEHYAKDKGIAAEALMDARLAPDMLPFSAQIQRASDTAKASLGRLTGQTPPSFADDEKTFADLRQRVAKTIDYLNTITPESMSGSADRVIVLPFLPTPVRGDIYATQFMLPNFFFHVTTAHSILRNQGMPIGKKDFLGSLDAAPA